jgi:hypothetical protein
MLDDIGPFENFFFHKLSSNLNAGAGYQSGHEYIKSIAHEGKISELSAESQ